MSRRVYEPASVRVTVRLRPRDVAAIDAAVERYRSAHPYSAPDRSEFVRAAIADALDRGAGRFVPASSDAPGTSDVSNSKRRTEDDR